MTALSAWRRTTVPSDILPLITAVFIGGSIAGFLAATPLLFVTTPLVAVCLAAAAAAGARKPEWNGMAGATLASLPAGRARELLVDLLRRAATVPAVAHADPLVLAACEAARQLSALEVHLEAFGSRSHEGKMLDAFERCRRGAALLTQRLEDASAALSRWQAAQGAGEGLGVLARELNDESRYQQEAAHELEVLLA